MAPALAILALLIFGYAQQPWVAYLAFVVTIVLLPMGIAGIRGQLALSSHISPGHLAGHKAFAFACGFLAFAAMPTYDILTRLKSRLGPELMRQRWSVDHRDRAVALVACDGWGVAAYKWRCLR